MKRFAVLTLLPLLFLAGCAGMGRAMTDTLRPIASPAGTPERTGNVIPALIDPMSGGLCRKHTCKTQISPTALPSPTPLVCIVDTGLDGEGWLNIRARPTVQSAILDTVPDGTVLNVIHPGAWSQVRLGDLTGWVNTTYCTEEKP